MIFLSNFDHRKVKLMKINYSLAAVFCKSPKYSFCTTQMVENFHHCHCMDLLMQYQEQVDAVPQKTTIFQGSITIIIPKISQFSCFLHNETDETVTLKHCIYALFYCSFAEKS